MRMILKEAEPWIIHLCRTHRLAEEFEPRLDVRAGFDLVFKILVDGRETISTRESLYYRTKSYFEVLEALQDFYGMGCVPAHMDLLRRYII